LFRVTTVRPTYLMIGVITTGLIFITENTTLRWMRSDGMSHYVFLSRKLRTHSISTFNIFHSLFISRHIVYIARVIHSPIIYCQKKLRIIVALDRKCVCNEKTRKKVTIMISNYIIHCVSTLKILFQKSQILTSTQCYNII